LLSDFELYGTLSFLLQHDRASRDACTVGDVAHSQLHQVAGSQLAVDCQVEKSKIPRLVAKLQANPYRPDVAQPKGRLLSDELALVLRLTG